MPKSLWCTLLLLDNNVRLQLDIQRDVTEHYKAETEIIF